MPADGNTLYQMEAAHPAPPSPAPVAPAWHTVLFVAVVIGTAVLAARSQGEMIARHGRLTTYLVTMFWEYVLVGYILWGAQKKNVTLRDLAGGRWNTPKDFAKDWAVAFGFWILAAGILAGLSYALGLASPTQMAEAKKHIGPLLPANGVELGVWLALSATAGFCEEIMFRGYLQKQLSTATRSEAWGIVLQAIFFGIAHYYQGPRRVVLIGVYGAMFGMLAAWRRSLRPGMFAHALQDSVSGIASRLLK